MMSLACNYLCFLQRPEVESSILAVDQWNIITVSKQLHRNKPVRTSTNQGTNCENADSMHTEQKTNCNPINFSWMTLPHKDGNTNMKDDTI